jgi:hypothetical protein
LWIVREEKKKQLIRVCYSKKIKGLIRIWENKWRQCENQSNLLPI